MTGVQIASSPNPRSEFIVYVDESGDHSLEKVDDAYPVFVLSFCVFYKENYVKNVVSALERLKFEKFGHDIIILHEREIRKELGIFKFRNRGDKEDFLNKLSIIIDDSKFILISAVIDKRNLNFLDREPPNPYHVALDLCLETLVDFLTEKGQENLQTHIVFERRGDKEDKELELEFRRICDGANRLGRRLPFEIILADKRVNSAGLQLADLVARPVGIHYLRPSQINRAFEILKMKFFCRGGRQELGNGYEGWGLKIYKEPKSEKPR
ncbi:MAG: DUF3800 domain-containing protein [Novosphingobium sp.]